MSKKQVLVIAWVCMLGGLALEFATTPWSWLTLSGAALMLGGTAVLTIHVFKGHS